MRLGGLPPSIAWAARRLRDVTVGALVEEMRRLRPRDQVQIDLDIYVYIDIWIYRYR